MTSFYSDPAVWQRLVDFMGGDSLETATSTYLTHSDGCLFQRAELKPPGELQWFLDRDLDIARSLADRESLLLHLDVEYVNFDLPGEAYLDPWRTFALQEPVVRVIERLLLGWGIVPLHMVTGQGHHFVWRVRLGSEVGRRITALNPAPELVDACMSRVGGGVTAGVTRRMQESFSGLALLMDFVAQRIKLEAAPLSKLPVELTAVHVGAGVRGQREMISIDISEYGDPLHTRMVRMPFTNYLKPWLSGLAKEMGIEESLPRFRTVPLFEMDVQQALECRRNEERVLDLAQRASTKIPLQEKGTSKMMDDYMASRLREFHHYFYSAVHDPQVMWPFTYDHTPLENFPRCVADLLAWPNDRLLKPGGIQLVTRALLADGWHPRHIGGLIRSKFENPAFGWGVNWREYEPGTRADFYTRLFAGLWATGVDKISDFNCQAVLEKGICQRETSSECSLEPHYQILSYAHDL
jgi:hypothetical protein